MVLSTGTSSVYGHICNSYAFVASLVDVSEKSVRNWVHDWEINEIIRDSKRGHHPKTFTPIHNLEFRKRFIKYVKENNKCKGKAVLTADKLGEWVNTTLHLDEKDHISDRTIVTWLHACGFNVRQVKKGIYIDGHERPDVVEDRMRFIREYNEILKKCQTIDDETLQDTNNTATYILVNNDEKAHHSNDVQKR